MRTIIRNIIRTIIRIIERTPIDNREQKNITDKEKYLQDFELDSKDGFTFGSLRLADVDIDVINNIIKEDNYKTARLETLISPEHQELYEQVKTKRKLFTFDEFINLEYPINERSRKFYKKDLDGFFEYIQDIKPQLAIFFLDYFQPYFKDSVRHCHTYMTGKTGLGKSEVMKNIIYNHILRKNCSVILLEPHGDLSEQVYKSKIFLDPEQAKRLVVIDNNLSKDKTPIINIFDQIKCDNEEDLDIFSQNLAKALTGLCSSQGQAASLTERMETVLRFCVRVVLRIEGSCLQDLIRFMSNDNADLIELGKKDPNHATRDFFENQDFNKGYKESKDGIYYRLQSIAQNTNFSYLTTGKSTINIRKIMNTRGILIVNLSKGGVGEYTSEAFGKLLIALIKTVTFLRNKQPEWQRRENTVHVFIDEFQNFMSDDVITILTEGRKYEVFFTLANQFVGQGLSDEKELKAFLGNTGMKIVAQTTPSNSRKITEDMFIKPEQVNKLPIGEYYLNYENSKKVPITIKIKGVEKYLKDSYENKTTWQTIKNAQVSTYYVEKWKYTYNATKPPQNENKAHYKPNNNKKESRKQGDKPNFNDSDFE
jgi:hypothetical protein